MGKKINNDAITIKALLSKGYTQARICRMLKLKKQKVSYGLILLLTWKLKDALN